MLNYLHWQFIEGPTWLMQTFWNLELALLQYFSVGLMLRTLFAHWHKDAVSYERGSFSQIFISFAWNQISRGIGFVIRSAVLFAWLIVQVIYTLLAAGLLVVFIAAPLLIAASLVWGLSLLL